MTLQALPPRPFRRADLPGRAVPFLVSAVATLLVLLVDTPGSTGSGWRVLAGALATTSVLLPVMVVWERLPRAADLRRADVLSRYGGEEFAIVLPDCGLTEAVNVMERLRLSTPGGQTCSIGLAEWGRGESGGMVFARADAALYSAKRRGRNRVRVAAGAA